MDNENPYASPVAEGDEANPYVEQQRCSRVAFCQHFLRLAFAWHFCVILIGVTSDWLGVEHWSLDALGGVTGVVVLIYAVYFASLLWGGLRGMVVGIVCPMPMVGLIGLGLIAYRASQPRELDANRQ